MSWFKRKTKARPITSIDVICHLLRHCPSDWGSLSNNLGSTEFWNRQLGIHVYWVVIREDIQYLRVLIDDTVILYCRHNDAPDLRKALIHWKDGMLSRKMSAEDMSILKLTEEIEDET